MLDLTAVSRAASWLFLGFFVAFFALGIVFAIVDATSDASLDLGGVASVVPYPFTVMAVVLVTDFFRRLTSARLTVTQVPGYRVAGVLTAAGAAFGFSSGRAWVVSVICLVIVASMCVPTRGRTVPSTWKPH